MQTTPFVSVIIVTYNRQDTLEKALRSLFVQDYPQDKYEIIVVDDGSTDRTDNLVKRLQKDYPFVYLKQEHKLSASARNLGIKKAKGEIICFLDSDCIAPSNWISSIINLYQLHPEVVSVGGWWEHIITKRGFFRGLQKILFYDGLMPKEGYVECIATRNSSYKKEVFFVNGFFDEKLGYPEDRDFNIRLTSRGYKIYFSPHLIVKHIHPFKCCDFYKREFGLGRTAYRLYLRWENLFLPQFRLPLNFKDRFIFWLVPFLKPYLILKDYGFSLQNIIYIPFLTLKYFIHHLGIWYEMVNLRRNKGEDRWKNP